MISGAAYIKWKIEATERLSKEIKEKQARQNLPVSLGPGRMMC